MLPVLKTNRLSLREVELNDAPALQAWQSNPEQWRDQAMEPEDFADASFRIQKYFEHRGEKDQRRLFVWVAELTASGELIGQASLSRSHPVIASLGIGISGKCQGQGLATELAQKLIEFGFQAMKLRRIEADVAVENEPCIKVLENVGMQYEGTIREAIWAQGKWWNEKKYSILQSD